MENSSVRVRPSGVVSKRTHTSSDSFRLLVGARLVVFSSVSAVTKFQGDSISGVRNTRGVENLRFSTKKNIAVYLGTGTVDHY